MLKAFYTLAIVLGVVKEDLGKFFQALKMVFDMWSIRVFSQFCCRLNKLNCVVYL